MPTFFPDGSVLAGASYGGQDILSVDNQPMSALGPVGWPRALSWGRVILSRESGVAIWNMAQPVSPTNPQVVGPEASWLAGAGDVWAYRRQSNPPVYADVWAPTPVPSDWRPCDAGLAGILRMGYAAGRVLQRWDGTTAIDLLPGDVPLFNGEARWVPGSTAWVARLSNTQLAMGSGAPLAWRLITVPFSTDLAVASARYVVTWSHPDDSMAVLDLVEYRIAPIGPKLAYNACARLVSDDVLQVAWSTTQGERPGTMAWQDYALPGLQWRAFAGPVPGPDPVPPSSAVIPVRPWPITIWIAPYQSFNTNQWGDTDDFVGNCILKPDSREHATALASKGLPMIVEPDVYSPSIASLVVGYFRHVDTMADAEAAVADLKAKIASGAWPEKPLVLYVDKKADVWNIPRPTWLDPKWIWPSPQCYRAPGEPLAAFDARIRQTLTHLAGWGGLLFPTVHAFDRNGLGTVTEAVEALGLARQWANDFDIIGLAPFTDMRRNDAGTVGGMEVYPALRTVVRSFQFADPRDRPSRDDGWVSKAGRKAQILRKLSQSTRHPYLDTEDKAFISAALNGLDPDPDPGPDPVPDPDINVKLARLHAAHQAERAKYPERLERPEDAGNIQNDTALEVKDDGWHLSAKPTGNRVFSEAHGRDISYDIFHLMPEDRLYDAATGEWWAMQVLPPFEVEHHNNPDRPPLAPIKRVS